MGNSSAMLKYAVCLSVVCAAVAVSIGGNHHLDEDPGVDLVAELLTDFKSGHPDVSTEIRSEGLSHEAKNPHKQAADQMIDTNSVDIKTVPGASRETEGLIAGASGDKWGTWLRRRRTSTSTTSAPLWWVFTVPPTSPAPRG